MGRLLVIPGADFTVAARKTIAYTALDKLLARTPGLLHYIDPDEVEDPSNFRERCGKQLLATTPPALVASVAAFNGHSALDFEGVANADLHLVAPSFTRSFTFIAAVLPSAATLANNSEPYLFSAKEGATRRMFLRHNLPPAVGSAQLLVSNNVNAAAWVYGGGIVAGTPAIVAATADLDTLDLKVWRDDFTTPKAVGTASSGLPDYPAASYYIGNSTPIAAGSYKGKIGKVLIFDRDMSKSPYDSTFTQILDLMQAEYGL